MQIRRRLKRNMRRALTTSLTPERSAPTTIANDLNSYGNLEHGLQQLDSSRGGRDLRHVWISSKVASVGASVTVGHEGAGESSKELVFPA